MATVEELQLKVKTDASQAEKAITGWSDHVESKAKKAGRAMENAGKKMSTKVTLPLLAAGGAAISLFTKQEDATRKLASTFDSTGAAAWTSMEALQANADALQQITTHGDEAIEEMQSVLLTFTQIKGDEFDDATVAILNMSDALGMDLQSASVMVGKALNDPVAGISAMSRAGITFSDSQKEMIKTMVEAGDTAGAQAVMLGELETQFGGTAEAMAETSSGQMKQAMNTMGDSMEEVGAILVPILVNIVNHVKKVAEWFSNLSPGMQKVIVAVLGVVAAVGPMLIIAGKLTTAMTQLAPAIKGVGGAIKWVTTSAFGPWMIAIAAAIAIGILIWKNWDTIKAVLLKVFRKIRDVFKAVVDAMKAAWESTWNAIKTVVVAVVDAIKNFIKSSMDAVKRTVTGTIDGVKRAWNTVWGGIKDTFTSVWDAIVGAVEKATGTVSDTITGVIDTVTDAWATFTSFLSDAWDAVWDTLSDGIGAAIDGAINVIKAGLNGVIGALERAINGLINILNKAIGGYNAIPLAPDLPKIPNVSVPRLAEGGMTLNDGPVRVGERGIEIVNLPAGATVRPDAGPGAVGNIIIERMDGGDPKAIAQEIGWEFTKRGIA